MPHRGSRRRRTVRMFPDYADTVLWCGGPVPYSMSGLSRKLVRDLVAWEQFYYDALRADLVWKSAELSRDFTQQGDRLAARLAQELGEGYEVEFRSYEPGVPARICRESGAARNPCAVTAFDRIVRELGCDADESESSATEHPDADRKWSAYAPRSGKRYDHND